MKNDLNISIFCTNIKTLRLREKLSKTAMCKILKVSMRSLNSIENGILPPRTSCEVLVRACIYFDIRPKDILSIEI